MSQTKYQICFQLRYGFSVQRSSFDEKGLPTIAAITINIRQVASNEGEKMLALINKIKDGKGVITIV